MPGLCPSTLHVYSTYVACADQLMDAGRCTATGSGRRGGTAPRRRRAAAQRSQAHLRHMDCQRAAVRPAGSSKAGKQNCKKKSCLPRTGPPMGPVSAPVAMNATLWLQQYALFISTCDYVFLDIGSNRGMHSKFLYGDS